MMKYKKAKYLYIVIFLIFPLMGFSQTEDEIKSMLTGRGYYRFGGVDSATQKTIVENTWEKIYDYDYNKKYGKFKKSDLSSILTFEGDTFSYRYCEKDSPIFHGKYEFNWNFLYYGDEFDESAFEIIDLIDNEYLIVEKHLQMVRNKKRVDIYKLKSTHHRELYQRQNMTQIDRMPHEKRAKQMLTAESQLEDTIIPSSIEKVWKLIYSYDNNKIFKLEKITYEVTLELKDGKLYINNYCSDMYCTGQYIINGQILSYVLDTGYTYHYKFVNGGFNNEYLIMERIWNIERYKNKPQRPISRMLFKRIE